MAILCKKLKAMGRLTDEALSNPQMFGPKILDIFCNCVIKPDYASIRDMLRANFKYEVLRTVRVSRLTIHAGKKLIALSDEESDVLLNHTSAVVNSLVTNNKCRTVILGSLPPFPTRCCLSPEHSQPGSLLTETIDLIRDLNYLGMSLPAFDKLAWPLRGDAGHFFLSFHILVKGAFITPYNSSGIVGLNNVHLTRIILSIEPRSSLFFRRTGGSVGLGWQALIRQESSSSSSKRKLFSLLVRLQKKRAYEHEGYLRTFGTMLTRKDFVRGLSAALETTTA